MYRLFRRWLMAVLRRAGLKPKLPAIPPAEYYNRVRRAPDVSRAWRNDQREKVTKA